MLAIILLLLSVIHPGLGCHSQTRKEVEFGDPVRHGRTSFAFLEGCRVHLFLWHEDLRVNYRLSDENSDNPVKFAQFSEENGYLNCFDKGTLTYIAEVPCQSFQHPHFSYTKEMCETPVNYTTCMDFYDAIIKPTPLYSSPKCGIGSICFSQFEVDFVKPVACPPQYASFKIDVAKYTEGGKFKSPTVAEYNQYILTKNHIGPDGRIQIDMFYEEVDPDRK